MSGGGKGAEGRRRLLVGLTGGIATGKSTVAELFRERGAVVIDADRIARQVVEPGQPALEEIRARFGPEFIDGSGALRRDRMAREVFSNPAARRQLEAILHPYIAAEMERQVEQAPPGAVVVLDIPLLYETGRWLEKVDVAIVVYADREAQITRLKARDGLSQEAAEQRLAAQWPTAVKLARADVAIYNQSSRDALVRQVDDVWDRLQRRREAE